MNGQPGERLIQAALNGQIDGQRLGQVLFQLLPALPHEGPPVPRVFLSRGVPQGQVFSARATEVVQPVAQVPAAVVLAAPAPVIPAPRQYIPQVGELRLVRTFVLRVKELPGL